MPSASSASGASPLPVGRAVSSTPPLVEGELDELAGDARATQLLPGARRQVRGELDERVVGADVDVSEVRSAESALVGDGADDLPGLDVLSPPDRDPVRGEWAAGATPSPAVTAVPPRSEEHTSELQSRRDLVCRLLLEQKKK